MSGSILSPVLSNIPFVNHNDGNRIQMASSMSKQALVLVERELPHVASFHSLRLDICEYFVKRTPISGTVQFIDDYVFIYNDKQCVLIPIPGLFEVKVNENDQVKAGQVIAQHMLFKDNQIQLGKNLNVIFSMFKYRTHEDAIVISESAAKKLTSIHYDCIDIELDPKEYPSFAINPEIQENKTFAEGTWILRDRAFPRGRILEKFPVDCVVDKIEVYLPRNLKNLKLDDNTYNFLQKYNAEKQCEKLISKFPKYSKYFKFYFKNPEPNIRIKIYIHYIHPLRIGDKFANRYGNKGVVSYIAPDEEIKKYFKGKIPESFIPEVILSTPGVHSRMNPGQIAEMYLGYLARYVIPTYIRKMLKNEYSYTSILNWLYRNVYKVIYDENSDYMQHIKRMLVKYETEGKLEIYAEKLIKRILTHGFQFYFDCIEKNILLRVKHLIKHLAPKLLEYEYGFGVMYMLKLEHIAFNKLKVQSTGEYSKKKFIPLNGQRLGEMEIWNLLAYDVPYFLYENITLKSDNHKMKEGALKQILEKGEVSLKTLAKSKGQVYRLFEEYLNVLLPVKLYEQSLEIEVENQIVSRIEAKKWDPDEIAAKYLPTTEENT